VSHATLAPSAASRWLACTRSARLEELIVSEGESNYADEGTLAHVLGELIISYKLQQVDQDKFHTQLKVIAQNKHYHPDMYYYCEEYAMFVLEKFAEIQSTTKDAKLYTEVKLDLSQHIPDSYGTSDIVIVGEPKLVIIDLKYGKGVPVSAVENKQEMVYALGVLGQFEFLFDIKQVEMIIYQPRLDSISSYEMSVDELKKWATDVLEPRAKLAYAGDGEFVVGEHCRFCKVKTTCRAHAEYNLELAKFDFSDPNFLTDEEIVEILSKMDIFINWIKAVDDYALAEALKGKKWPGMKIVHGRSNRVIDDPEQATATLLKKGYKPEEILNTKLKGLGDLTKLLGKNKFEELLNKYIVKPPGSPTLVSLEDKRPEVNGLDDAKNDFSDN
jgi:hypothetical protein